MGELHSCVHFRRSSSHPTQVPSALCGMPCHPRIFLYPLIMRIPRITQLFKRSAHGDLCRDQEDHETFQHTSTQQTNLPRAETPQAHSTRERPSIFLLFERLADIYWGVQIISLSDVFISPLEDMLVPLYN